MKRLILLLACLTAAACGHGRYGAGIPAAYDAPLDAALARTPRADTLAHCPTRRPATNAKPWPI